MFEKNLNIAVLLDFYGDILTERQKDMLDMYYNNDLSLAEIYEAVDLVRDVVDSECNIIFGATIDENIKDEVQVTVIATGFDMKDQSKQPAQSQVIKPNMFSPVQPQPVQPELVQSQPVMEEDDEDDDDIEDQDYEEDVDDEEDDDRDEEPENKVEDISYSSKIDLGDTSIPPFLRKLRK